MFFAATPGSEPLAPAGYPASGLGGQRQRTSYWVLSGSSSLGGLSGSLVGGSVLS